MGSVEPDGMKTSIHRQHPNHCNIRMEARVYRHCNREYKAVRNVTGAYHGARQDTLGNIAKVEPVQVKLWDMRVKASTKILEKGV